MISGLERDLDDFVNIICVEWVVKLPGTSVLFSVCRMGQSLSPYHANDLSSRPKEKGKGCIGLLELFFFEFKRYYNALRLMTVI